MIELKSLVRRFTLGDETIMAVDHVDLMVNKGDFISIVGPSGSGKSTLMNIIGMLDRADEGTYLFDNMDVTQLSDDDQAEIRNRKIGFVFQSFFLLPKLDATENVMVPLLYRGVSEKIARTRAEEMLDKMGLSERKHHLPSELSGGQQQRVAIARALVGDPELILADEPTGALDSKSGRDIVKLLRGLNENGQTIVLITHDTSIAAEAKRRIRITDGRLYEESSREITAETPAEDTPSADTSAEEAPVEDAPSADTPTEESPAADAPTAETPTEESPAADAPVEDAPTADTPTEESPAEDAPADESPSADALAAGNPAADAPDAEVQTEDAPAEESPAADAPTAETPAEESPAEDIPAADNPPEDNTDEEVSE